MMLKHISHRLPSSIVVQKHQEERQYWKQCQRLYTFQPIYEVSGRLMAIELLTAVFHPAAPSQRLSPEDYFAALDISQRLHIVEEQLELLSQWEEKFVDGGMVASVNIDGPSLLALQHNLEIRALIARLPWVRFELVEHHILPQEEVVAQMPELGPLWLDDFGSGMANFSALTELKYDYIKLARELFILLRKTEEGRNLFAMLLALINRYCKGVIVEGVETAEEWAQVQGSPAFAAQGYYFSRPVPFEQLTDLPLQLA
ncbi:EAL domain-containing protein (putative c-di-GMP-specific phosphodiesterase class I) [Erwinia toletana]|uniref:EAL domain-containing protein (Putative c-di-GMP-specific phosphodiesterase class I) n=1 Tax=Winslowiella toletana TaxID=92490 RepID=A0ABS4P8C3_9GAMM|nr:cyclic-guanylate-specific phosphodiesterase [Winslowiella toletana]MBP2168882.1 EAL domain-containing protein (putative c-di-GMP-specific phosphodiesterase class I) [Winslowiella toletana]